MSERILNFPVGRHFNEDECNAWEQQVNEEIVQYLAFYAGDMYDKDCSIFNSIVNTTDSRM